VDRHFYKHKALHYGEQSMAHAVESAGGTPLFLPLPQDLDSTVPALVSAVDGIILSGGSDVAPGSYGEQTLDERWAGQPERDAFEMAVAHQCLAQDKRLLGICRGLQVINVAMGGSLWQDLQSLRPDSNVHRSQEQYDALGHDIDVADDTLLAGLIGDGRQYVNSVHHQGIRRVADNLRVWATAAEDHVIESVGDPDDPNLLAVQWHPEWMADDPGAQAIFGWLLTGETDAA
jgi:putative glutamine amidotransferase